jgi:hypothetical protein
MQTVEQDNAQTWCVECGGAFVATGICTGYATTQGGARICYACADAAQHEEMRTAQSMFAYLSSDGRTISTWTGGALARVTSEHTQRVGFGFRPSRTYLQAIAPDGSRWHGTSPGRGMFCRMKRSRA